MAYTTIDDASKHFHINLHNGNETNNTDITFDANAGDFQPDFIWFKGRTSSAIDHALFDSSRGTTKILSTNNTTAENAQGSTLKAFNSNGFRVGDDAGDYGVNKSGRTYVTWNWKLNGGTTSSNSDGSITSTVQANTTAGFSIVTFSGNTTAGATVGHGLGVAPKYIQVRRYDRDGDAWRGFWEPLGNEKYMELNATDAIQDSANGAWNDTSPTNSVFSLGGAAGINGGSMIAYCFAPIQGYSEIGSYEGTGETEGPFVYTGFRPAWLLYRNVDRSENWIIVDDKRKTKNEVNNTNLQTNVSDAEATETRWGFDFCATGFKVYQDSGQNANNGNDETIIYMAFARNPFVTSKGAAGTAGATLT